MPAVSEKFQGSFWGITSFFNPTRSRRRVENYRRFREFSRRQGLRLICVELAFGRSRFELSDDDADVMLRRRSGSVLWQKERLLNIGLQALPPDCDKLAWLDADIIFLNENWVCETQQLLEDFKVVQPYTFVARMPREDTGVCVEQMPPGAQDGQRTYGMAYGLQTQGMAASILHNILKHGDPGFAWACRRELIQQNGFYDRLVMGGGDLFMAHAFFGNIKCPLIYGMSTDAMRVDQEKWCGALTDSLKGRVAFCSGTIKHLWHGAYRDRFYGQRQKILQDHHFDPAHDIRHDENGCWIWASWKPGLHLMMALYFKARNEDGSWWICFMTRAALRIMRFFSRLLVYVKTPQLIAAGLMRRWKRLTVPR